MGFIPVGICTAANQPSIAPCWGSSSFHLPLYDEGSYQQKTIIFLGVFTEELLVRKHQAAGTWYGGPVLKLHLDLLLFSGVHSHDSCSALLISLVVNIPTREGRDQDLSTYEWEDLNSYFPQHRDKWDAHSLCPPSHVAAAAEPKHICPRQMGMSCLVCPCEGTKEHALHTTPWFFHLLLPRCWKYFACPETTINREWIIVCSSHLGLREGST